MHIHIIVVMSLIAAACGGATTEAPSTSRGGGDGDTEAVSEPVRLLDDEEAARTQAQAMQAHLQARELRTQCDEEGDSSACAEAESFFRIAADTWRALVEGRPDDEAGVDWSFMLAQALFHSGSFEASARSAERYLDSGSTEWRVQAAATLVAARERVLGAEMHTAREAPPEARGNPPAVEPLEIPDDVQALVDARARFIDVVPTEQDEDENRRQYALDNAILLHRYGHWEAAGIALRSSFVEGCVGPSAWAGAEEAWRALRFAALALGRYDAVRSLGEELESLGCDFGDSAPPSCGGDSDHPACLARTDQMSGQLHGAARFMQRAEHARGAERRRWAGRAGAAFIEAVQPGNELDPLTRITALVQAGRAFRMAGDAASARQVDGRIVTEVDPSGLDSADRSLAVVTVASALSRQLEAAGGAEEREEIVRLAERLGSTEFDLPELSEERANARRLLAVTLVALGRHDEASRAFADLARAAEDEGERRDAELSSALELAAAGPCRRAMRALRSFVQTHSDDAGARDAVITALWNVASCQRGRQRAVALEAVVSAAEGARAMSGQAREYAARATFERVDGGLDGFARGRIRLPRVDDVEGIIDALREELEGPSGRARELIEGYARVEAVGDARWTAAARYESGRVLDALEVMVRDATWQIPNDLQQQRRHLNSTAFAQLRGIVETRVEQILAAQTATIHCRARAHYERAIFVASRANVDSERVRASRERISEDSVRCPSRR